VSGPVRTARVRCPSGSCGRTFEVLSEWLGRNMYCPACGVRMTARPVDVEESLERRRDRVGNVAAAGSPRLPLVALADNLRSLWNVGSIFRTADACGLRELVLAGITGCPPRPEISKTALGAEQVVAWSYYADAEQALARLRGEGYEPVALETTERSVPIDAVHWPARICLVIGNEVAGVSPGLLEACPLHAEIPMHGVKSSLNVAVAFGIAAHRASSALRAMEPAGEGGG
jgi:23S rRNA (guanosine2251-2'-O)-methyltransferase